MNFKGLKQAAYPSTTVPEQESADLFHSLLDRRFVMGSIQVSDKVPNTDGLLTLIDTERRSIGFLDIQLKTLDKRHKHNPKFQCKLELLAYAANSMVPVILIVLDKENKKAYWLHLSKTLLGDLEYKIKGQSVSIQLNPDDYLGEDNLSYKEKWTKIVKDVKFKVHNYDAIVAKQKEFEIEIGYFGEALVPAFSLGPSAISEIHQFLDILNNLLQREFKIIKDALYFNYWKIAIVIVDYGPKYLSFYAIPQLLTDNSPLIKQIKNPQPGISTGLYFNHGAITSIFDHCENQIKSDPERLALQVIEKDLSKVLDQFSFGVDHRFAAIEYIWRFAESYKEILSLGELTTIPIATFNKLVFRILPIALELRLKLSKKVTEYLYDFKDHDYSVPLRLSEAEGMVDKGYIPSVDISILPGTFNYELLEQYVIFLEGEGISEISNPYLPVVLPEPGTSFSKDAKKAIYSNLVTLFENFLECYTLLIRSEFPLLEQELDYFGTSNLFVLVLNLTDVANPKIESYVLQSLYKEDGRLLIYDSESSDCPLRMDMVLSSEDREFVIDGSTYKVLSWNTAPIQFLFDPSPLNTLLFSVLKSRFIKYFKGREVYPFGLLKSE